MMAAFVSARYSDPGPIPLPPGSPQSVNAIDEEGLMWALREDSIMGEWVSYLENGGVIDPYVPGPVTSWDVNAERDRRITGGFDYMGYRFQSDEFSQRNMADATQAATGALSRDSTLWDDTNYRWQENATEDFVWLTADNQQIPMGAPTVARLGQTMIRFKQHCVFVGRTLKDTDPIPMDYKDDSYWIFEWSAAGATIPIINVSNQNPATVKVSSADFTLFSVGQRVKFVNTGSPILDDPSNSYNITSTNDVGKSFKIDCDLSSASGSYTTGSVTIL
jgi:Domain of unknown function (DUF4376)